METYIGLSIALLIAIIITIIEHRTHKKDKRLSALDE